MTDTESVLLFKTSAWNELGSHIHSSLVNVKDRHYLARNRTLNTDNTKL
jgi:hypothetical protein